MRDVAGSRSNKEAMVLAMLLSLEATSRQTA
jgi:hypothetical protein